MRVRVCVSALLRFIPTSYLTRIGRMNKCQNAVKGKIEREVKSLQGERWRERERRIRGKEFSETAYLN